ncbi:MAG: hypothetical protein HQM09_19010, partial [Candidatus Riflebacteria bacterium]|nr:hypothetical protein [Candidatus Riflebacteria bacterium]
MRTYLVMAFLLFSGLLPAHAWEFHKSLTLGYLHEDNITNEVMSRWQVKDWAKEATLKLGMEKEVSPGKRWSVSLDCKDHDNQNFNPYDRFYYGAKISYRQKMGLGMMAPWWRFQAGIGQEQYPNESLHDRRLSEFIMEYGKRINVKTLLSGSLGVDQSRGKNTNVLDLQGVSENIRCQYSLDSRWSVIGSFQSRTGDITSHAWEDYYTYEPSVYMDDWGIQISGGRFLDLGAGSGILAFALVKQG